MHSSEENIISSKIWYIVLQKDWKWRSDCLFENFKESTSAACCFHIGEVNEPKLSSNFFHLKTQHFCQKIKIFIIWELTTVVQITVRSKNLKELDKTDLSSNFLCKPNTFRHFIAILEVKKSVFFQKMPNDVTMTSFLTSLSTSDENANPNVAVSYVWGTFCKKHIMFSFLVHQFFC